jgi:hypothetical protein
MPNTSRDKERHSRREKIERMIAVEGKTIHETAKYLGCTYDQVYNLVTRHDIKPPKAQEYADRDHLAADPNYLIPAIRKALGCRIDERKDGYRLDGRPVSFGDVVRAANLIHKRRGMDQIGNNPAWWAQ